LKIAEGDCTRGRIAKAIECLAKHEEARACFSTMGAARELEITLSSNLSPASRSIIDSSLQSLHSVGHNKRMKLDDGTSGL
jgi:hypothetical protein